MDWLDFARGPALQASVAVFVLGTIWRLIGIFALRWNRIASPPRENAPGALRAAIEGNIAHMWPKRTFLKTSLFSVVNGYIFHLGLAVAVFLFAPHVLFFRSVFGVGWPALPNNVIYGVSVIVAVSLLAALVHRLSNPVQRLISRVDDYLSWLMTMLPVLTGLAAASHLGLRYETLLAMHILSICAFLVWFPFGKLMHAFLFVASRGATGVRFRHRGAVV